MKKYAFFLFFYIFCTSSFAQKKSIPHQQIELDTILFGTDISNLETLSNAWNASIRLDSLTFLSDTSALIVCTDLNSKNHYSVADTAYHYPIFSLKYDLDSIKNVLDTYAFFKNPMDETVFVGYYTQREVEIIKAIKKEVRILTEQISEAQRGRRVPKKLLKKEEIPLPIEVKVLQEKLKQVNYYHGEINNVLCDATRQALIQYRADNNMVEIFEIDDEVMDLLGISY